MPRPGAPVIIVCVALAAFAALLPGASGLDYAILSPAWVVVPGATVVVVSICADCCDDQPLALFSLAPSRAPPVA